MLRNISVLFIITCWFTACKKEQIEVYQNGHFVQFINPVSDTTEFSFFYFPGKNEVQVAIPIKLIGHMPKHELHYSLEIDSEHSELTSNAYSFSSDLKFRSGMAQDTAYITFINQPDLASKKFLFCLKIKETSDVKVGQTNYATRIFRVSDMIAKPTWWNSDMDRFYLGIYSEKKFRAFMEVTGQGDLSIFTEGEQRILMLQFKYYLIKQKENGTPLLLEDGSDMLNSMPLLG